MWLWLWFWLWLWLVAGGWEGQMLQRAACIVNGGGAGRGVGWSISCWGGVDMRMLSIVTEERLGVVYKN